MMNDYDTKVYICSVSYACIQTNEYVQYFARHIDDTSKQTAMTERERMTQDQDKRRTYDMARLTYSQVTIMQDPLNFLLLYYFYSLRSTALVTKDIYYVLYLFATLSFPALQMAAILFVDSDELFFCSATADRAAESSSTDSPLKQQQDAQHRMIRSAIAAGYDEIQVPRVSQFTRMPINRQNSRISSVITSSHDATETSIFCMQEAYRKHNKSLSSLLECWSAVYFVDKNVNPKSIDVSSRCPFRYNHYSCAIHKPYRREKYRCHCNIKFVEVKECRIVHLNNKFLSDYLNGAGNPSSRSALLSVPLSDLANLWHVHHV
jgi:hypothetical protein